jgi:hypothetical protein
MMPKERLQRPARSDMQWAPETTPRHIQQVAPLKSPAHRISSMEAIIIEPLAKITKQEKAGGPP